MADQQRKPNPDIEPNIRPDFLPPEGGTRYMPEDLAQAERGAGSSTTNSASSEASDSTENVSDQEGAGADPNAINSTFTGRGSDKQKVTAQGVLKKGGPVAGIVGLLIAVAGIVSFFGGPGLLIVNMAEVITDKFNTQLASMDARTTRILQAKFDNSTTGACSGPINIRCKFASFSDREIQRFKDAGIEFNDTKSTVLGRSKPSTITFADDTGTKITIKPSEFRSTLRTNTKFAQAVVRAYNPKFAGFSDKAWNKLATKLKVSKRAPFSEEDDTPEKRAAKLRQTTNTGDESAKIAGGVTECERQNNCTPEQQEENNRRASSVGNELDDTAKEVARTGTKTATRALSHAVNVVKITGLADDACMALNTINAISQGAKIIRAAQMARFAMVFLTTASMIKAGDAQPDDVEYLGNTLTQTFSTKNADDTTTTTKGATDSFGYRYAAFGDTGIDDNASQYIAGGGLGGTLATVTGTIISVITGDYSGKPNPTNIKNAKSTCHTLNNPIVQVGTFVAGIAVFLIPGAGQAISASKIIAQAALAAAMFAAETVLPSILADMVAGVLVDDSTVGEDAGNAYVSGAASMMSQLAAVGGNAPLTPAQAVAYTNLNQEVVAKYNAPTNQWDATNPNSFVGSLYTKATPYLGRLSSLNGILSIPFSFVGSAAYIAATPTARAESADDYTKCQDFDITTAGAAADELCNIVRGIPVQYLNDDPIAIADRLIATGDIDATTGEPISGDYKDVISQCMDRDSNSDDPNKAVDGSQCLINNQATADRYVHYIDLRVDDGMENGYDTGSGSTSDDNSSGGDNSDTTGQVGTGVMIGDKGPAGSCAAWIGQYVLPTYFGIPNPGGDGWEIASRLGSAGYAVDHMSAVHAIVSWPKGGVSGDGGHANATAGHVAIVYAVNADGSIEVEEHNYNVTNGYGTRHISAEAAKQLTYAHTEGKFKQ